MGSRIDPGLLFSPRFPTQTPKLDSNLMINRATTFGYLKLHMSRLARKHNQIVGSIVVLVPIDMMDNLAIFKRSPKFLLSNNPMNGLTSNLVVIRRVHRLVSATATHGAINATALLGVGWPRVKLAAAMHAVSLLAQSSASRIARLGAPSTPAGLSAKFACIVHAPIIADSRARNNGWFSPYCLKPARVRTLFDALEAAG